MNRYPLWKYLAILAVLLVGVFYALPNLYGEQPAVQISGTRATRVDAEVLRRAEQALKAAGLPYEFAGQDETGARYRFPDADTQLRARDLLQKTLGDRFVVALNLLPATPEWFERFNARPMYLGLDLRGGVHFLMEVDVDGALRLAEDRYVRDLRTALRKAKVRYRSVRRAAGGGIEIRFRRPGELAKARDVLDDDFTELDVAEVERDGETLLKVSLSEQARRDIAKFALEQNMTSLRNRVNELGVAEPIIQRQGDRRIVVQLPGVQDTAKAKELLGKTATLEIMLVDEEHDLTSALQGRVPPGSRIYYDRQGRPILLKKEVIYSGDNIIDAATGFDSRSGGPVVHITLDARGARINQRVTGENIGKRMAVVYIETITETKTDADGRPLRGPDGKVVKVKRRIEEVITAPVIRDQLGKRFQIEGLDSVEEARDLALLLRAGALATPVEIIEERTVGPSLGQANIEQGYESVLIGLLLVAVFIAVYYKVFGLVADLALFFNLVLIVAVLSLFQATLTMPGVAGIVLTVGMAVDANVLIFERIREELRNGNTPQASIHAGYDKAFSTIVDANITTLIAAIVLFNFGTGPIKGFAVTLSIGILTSMFTAILGTRAVVNLVFGGRRLKRLPV